MMAETAAQLNTSLRNLKQQRRDGELTLADYYTALLHMVGELASSLTEEVHNMDEEEIALQVPLILLFVEEQIRKFGDRTD